MKRTRKTVCSVLCVLCLACPLDACTVAWEPTTTTVDGTPVSGPVTYRVFVVPRGASTEQALGATTALSLTTVCPPGSYVVTAMADGYEESGPSNTVVLTQAGKSKPPHGGGK
jgi:hypothetical protein